jgi:hypothetical protein
MEPSRPFLENVVVFPDGSATWAPLETSEPSDHSSSSMVAVMSETTSASGAFASHFSGGDIAPSAQSESHSPISPATYTIRCHRSESPRLRELWLMAGMLVVLLLPLYWFPLWAKNIDSRATTPISCKTP